MSNEKGIPNGDGERTNIHQPEQEGQAQYQVSTLVQSVGNRSFELSKRKIDGTEILILEFPRGLTVLMAANDDKQPKDKGRAKLEVHRKFITQHEKYLHWIRFTFITEETEIQAQIMLQSRLGAAINLIRQRAYACFLQNPLRPLRRKQHVRKRTQTSTRQTKG